MKKAPEFLKDVFGFNRYTVKYRVTGLLDCDPDFVLSGSAPWSLCKWAAKDMASEMNLFYGEGTHWVERLP